MGQPRARSVSRDVTRMPARRAQRVPRERAQPQQPLMQVVNLVGRVPKSKRTAKAPVSTRSAPAVQRPRAVKRKDGTWVKGDKALQPPVCFEFRDTGYCRFGNRCKFSHSLPKQAQRCQPATRSRAYVRPKPQPSKPAKRTNNNRSSTLFESGDATW